VRPAYPSSLGSVKGASFADGTFTVPAWTTAVFVEPTAVTVDVTARGVVNPRSRGALSFTVLPADGFALACKARVPLIGVASSDTGLLLTGTTTSGARLEGTVRSNAFCPSLTRGL